MSEQKHLPAPEQLQGEMEQYLSGPEAEKNEKALSEALIAKAKLEELGVPVPAQLQVQIDELQAKNPLSKLPKWASKTEWVKVLQDRKATLEGAIAALDDIKPAIRKELEAEIARIDEKLVEPKEELGDLSRAGYAKKVTDVLGLEDSTESKPEKTLTPEQKEQILATLEKRFKENQNEKFHKGAEWDKIQTALEVNEKTLWSINEMEKAGHDPHVYFVDDKGFDIGTCSGNSPKSQRNCNYDEAVEMAKAMGIDLMTPKQYEDILQKLGVFDLDTRSWLKTPDGTRESGVALDGYSAGDDVLVRGTYPYARDDGRAFRGSLRVSWKKS